MGLNRITFVESDYKHPELEPVAEEIAVFLLKSSSYMLDTFMEIMRTSTRITIQNYKKFLQMYFKTIIKNRRKVAPDVLKLEELCYSFFYVCNDQNDISKMRGLVPEKLFEQIFMERHLGKDCRIGYGVKVLIDGKTIKYRPISTYDRLEDSDKPRQTVDAGFWDGDNAEFAEIKLQPEGFHTKDINYLRELSSELNSKDLSYMILLIALGDKDLIEKKLIRLGLLTTDIETRNEFILIGKDELYDLRFPA